MNVRFLWRTVFFICLLGVMLSLLFLRPWQYRLSSLSVASVGPTLSSTYSGHLGAPTSTLSSSTFITRAQSSLFLDNVPFRFSGANIYWLGLLETPDGVIYPSTFQVDDALATASLMGATVIRSHTLGISVGCELCLEPTLNVFNSAAFQRMDYAVHSASLHHLRLIIPLVDNYHYYHGGKHTFTDWRGIAYENDFYSNPLVIEDFQRYVVTILNHVNSYTGLMYKDDPTILAWETGNELSAPSSWVQMMAKFIKNSDSHHLVMDGNSEETKETTNFLPDLAITSIDLYTGHYYPPSVDDLLYELAQVQQVHKVFIVGEYDWNTAAGTSLSSFFSAIERSGVVGDMYWSLFGHDNQYGFVQHHEHYTLHYPGETSALRSRVNLVREHAYAMQGLYSPILPPPPAPLITSASAKLLTWRGAVGATNYSVERSTSSADGSWVLICNHCVTDANLPWHDTTRPPHSVWYRVKAFSENDLAGKFSPAYFSLS